MKSLKEVFIGKEHSQTAVKVERVQTIEEKVDEAYLLNERKKEIEAKLNKLKAEIKEHGKANDLEEVVGHKAYARFGVQPTVHPNNQKIYEYFVELDDLSTYWSVVSVKTGQLKGAVGRSKFEELVRIESDPFGKILLMKKPE